MINKLNINTVRSVDFTATCIIQDIEYILNNYNKNMGIDIEVGCNEIIVYINRQNIILKYKSLIDMLKISYSNFDGLYLFEYRASNGDSYSFNINSLPTNLFDYNFKEMYKKAKTLVENE